MNQVKVTLEVITPMFSFGADGKSQNAKAEFRITELKALLRSTFREIFEYTSIDDLKEKEEILFGSTNRKSPIFFKLIDDTDIVNSYKYMLPHKKVKNGENINKKKCKLNCIAPSSKISFFMFIKNDLYVDLYKALLIQASILGALGKRSRKGFGSFKIIDIEDSGNKGFNNLLKNTPVDILIECEKLINQKFKNLYKLRENTYIKDSNENLAFEKYVNKDLDFPYIMKITFIKIQENKDYKSCIEQISQLTHDRLPDGNYKNHFTEGIDNNEKIKTTILGNCRCEKTKVNRFASPVSVSFWENSKDKYMIIKELNYNYIFEKLKIYADKRANADYVNKFVESLVKIGEGKSK